MNPHLQSVGHHGDVLLGDAQIAPLKIGDSRCFQREMKDGIAHGWEGYRHRKLPLEGDGAAGELGIGQIIPVGVDSLGQLPLSGKDLAANDICGDGVVRDVEGDDLDLMVGGVGYHHRQLLYLRILMEFPADAVFRIIGIKPSVAHSAHTVRLDIKHIVGNPVNPGMANGVDILPVPGPFHHPVVPVGQLLFVGGLFAQPFIAGAGRDDIFIMPVAGKAVGGNQDGFAAMGAAFFGIQLLVGFIDDIVMQHPVVVVGGKPIRQLDESLFQHRRTIKARQRYAGAEGIEGNLIRNAPGPLGGHLGTAEVGGFDMPVSRLVDAGNPPEGAAGLHGVFQIFGVGGIQTQALVEGNQPFLRGVKLVGLNRGQSVGKHSLGIEGVHVGKQGFFQFFRLDAHGGSRRPDGGEIPIVRESAAKFAVFNLPLIDEKVDQPAHRRHIFTLAIRPFRHPRRDGSRVPAGLIGVPMEFMPVFCGNIEIVIVIETGNLIFRIVFEDIHQISPHPVKHIVLFLPRMFLQNVGIIVPQLNQPVGNMFFQNLRRRFEQQGKGASLQHGGRERKIGTADGQIQAPLLGQHPVPGIQPNGYRLMGQYGKVKMGQIAVIPQWILEFHRDGSFAGQVQSRQGQFYPVQPPAIIGGVGDHHLDHGKTTRRVLFQLGQGSALRQGRHPMPFIARVPSGDKLREGIQRRAAVTGKAGM